jgi:hypothetical protein
MKYRADGSRINLSIRDRNFENLKLLEVIGDVFSAIQATTVFRKHAREPPRRRTDMLKKILVVVLALFSSSQLATSQVATGAIITGTVTDSAQAVLPKAVVTVTEISTGVVTKTNTNGNGQYRTPPLGIGEYTIEVESAGFKLFSLRGLRLDIGAILEVNVTLENGETTETVQVNATSESLLQKADSTVGTVITNQQIEELPLNGGNSGRDYLQLAGLSAGTSTSSTGGVVIGGQAGTQAAFLLDGVDNNNQQISTSHSGQKEVIKPSVDAINEFKVVTNGYSADIGRSSSGVISVQIKSGANQLHGSAYEFIRNDAVDARNYFATKQLPFKYNDFGGTLGGPIHKNKVFLFGDLEFFRLRSQSPVYSLVPTEDQRRGQFSTAIYNPYTYNPATKSRTAYAGNFINTPLDPVAVAILNYIPQPNFTPTALVPNSNYLYNSPSNANNYRYDVRSDQVLGSTQTLFERYSSQQTRDSVAANLAPLNGNYVQGSGAQNSYNQAFVVGYNNAISPRFLLSVRLSWNNLYWYNFLPSQTLTSVGIPGVSTVNPGFTQLAISNFATLGVTNVPNIDDSQNRELAGDVTWSRGNHTIKIGIQQFWLQTNFNSSQKSTGVINFNGQYTSKSGASGSSDQAFADFLLGATSKEQLSSTALLNFRTPYTHPFIQDDWKVNRNLVINLGLRYELSPPPVDKFNGIANYDMDTTPSAPQLVRAGEFGSSRAQRALQDVSYTNIAPRFGFSYSPRGGNTVIRGGYGIFYSNMITLGGMSSLELNPPASLPRVTISPNATYPTALLANGFPPGTLSFTNGRNVELASYDRRAETPTAQQWNLNIQRELPAGILVEAGFYDNKFDHAWWSLDGNPAPPTPTSLLPPKGINANRRFQTTTIPAAGDPTITLADVIRIRKEGWSQYNSFQIRAEKRYSQGLTFITSYSYSKTIGIGDTNGIQDPTNINAERAVTATDQRNRFVGSAVYTLPFGHSKRFGANWNRWADGFLGGWNVSPIVTVASGLPLNLTEAANPSNTGGAADRPNLSGGWRAKNRSVAQWFNTSAFSVQPSGTFGNTPRNLIISPRTADLDAAVHKTIEISERLKAQLRLESFNVTNTAPLDTPGLDIGSPKSFGVISTAGNPRQNQVGVKLLF